jgi:hypothetical protein
MPYPMGAESLRAPAAAPLVVSVVSRMWKAFQELAWFLAFVLLVPVTVLVIGVPVAYLVKLLLWLAHVK